MENSIPEEGKKSDDAQTEAGKAPESASENEVLQSFSKKALWWGVFAVLVVVSVAFMRMAFPSVFYEKFLALHNDISLRHFVGCLIKLGFSLVWVGLFFALLRKLPLWGRGIILVIFFLPVAFTLYLRKYYGMEIDFGFIMDCMNTHWEEARGFISFHAVATLLAFIALMFAVAWLVGRVNAKLLRSKIFVGGLLLAFVFMTALPHSRTYIYSLRAMSDVNYSLMYYEESKSCFELLARQETEPQKVERVPTEISHVNALPVVVLHIAESARADHAPFNGYGRNTMPNMLREYEAGNLVSFPKCVSFSVKTVLSMRGILSPSTVLDNAFRHPTFLPVLNQGGIETCGFISGFRQDEMDRASFHDTWVEQMLRSMEEIVSTQEPALLFLPKIQQKLDVYATQRPYEGRFYLYYGEGSHSPFTHYDHDKHEIFKPTGRRICNDERDVNNYDNTFIATDEFCGGFIDALRNENAVYIFVGDHGTMIGEDGLQGRPYRRPESRHVLFFIWASDKFKAENPKLWATLVRNRERLGVVSHDFLYNSILHLFSLRTPFYDEKADLFSEAAEPFPTEMPEAEKFGPMRFGESTSLEIGAFE